MRHDGRGAIVERVALGGDQAQRAPRVAQLPSRVVEVLARRILGEPVHIALLGFLEERGDKHRRFPLQLAFSTPAREKGHGQYCKTGSERLSGGWRCSSPTRVFTSLSPPSKSERCTFDSTSSILRCRSIHTGRMLQLWDVEQRSSPTGCDWQCRSNVVVSDASITSRMEISSDRRASM